MIAVGSSVQSQISAASVSNATISDERYVGQKTEISNLASPTVTLMARFHIRLFLPYP